MLKDLSLCYWQFFVCIAGGIFILNGASVDFPIIKCSMVKLWKFSNNLEMVLLTDEW